MGRHQRFEKSKSLFASAKSFEGSAKRNLGVKPGVLSKRVDLIIKEEEKGGEVLSRTNDLDFVDKYFSIKGYSVEDKELN